VPVGAAVGDEYVTLNIGGKLAAARAVGRLLGWTICGAAAGLVDKPAKTERRRTAFTRPWSGRNRL
jgi:hypothetical protein